MYALHRRRSQIILCVSWRKFSYFSVLPKLSIRLFQFLNAMYFFNGIVQFQLFSAFLAPYNTRNFIILECLKTYIIINACCAGFDIVLQFHAIKLATMPFLHQVNLTKVLCFVKLKESPHEDCLINFVSLFTLFCWKICIVSYK